MIQGCLVHLETFETQAHRPPLEHRGKCLTFRVKSHHVPSIFIEKAAFKVGYQADFNIIVKVDPIWHG